MDDSDTVLHEANKLLAYLRDHVDADWSSVLNRVLSPTEFTSLLGTINAALTAVGTIAPAGAFLGGTGALKTVAGLGPDAMEAIRLAKITGRIVQAGQGRGRAIVLISAEPISRSGRLESHSSSSSFELDVEATLLALRNRYRRLTDELATVTRERDELRHEVDRLQRSTTWS